MRTSRSLTTVMTANGEVQTREKPRFLSKNWTCSWRLCFLKKLPQFFHSGSSARIMGILTAGPETKNHISPKRQENWLQFIKLFTIRSPWFINEFLHDATRASSLSSSQDSVFGRKQIHRKSSIRVRSYGETRKEVEGRSTQRSIAWLQDFREILVDESGPSEPRWNPAPKDQATSSSSHEVPMESLAKVEPSSGKHSIYTHFPKDPNCDICLKTKITRASCKRRAGTVVPRADNFGDMITADHKILSEESESRNNHRCAVVVQDLATQSFNEVPVADEETKSHLHWQFLGIWQVLWGIILESLYVNATQIRNKWNCRKNSAQSERRDICGIAAIGSGQWMVGGFHGVLLLSAKYSGSLVWWEHTLWKAVRNAL